MNDHLPMSDPAYQAAERERIQTSGLGDTPLPKYPITPLSIFEQMREREEYEQSGGGDTLDFNRRSAPASATS